MNISDLTPDQIDEIFLFKLTDLMRTAARQGKSMCALDFDPAASLGLPMNPSNPNAGKITVVVAGGASRDLLKQAIDLVNNKH